MDAINDPEKRKHALSSLSLEDQKIISDALDDLHTPHKLHHEDMEVEVEKSVDGKATPHKKVMIFASDKESDSNHQSKNIFIKKSIDSDEKHVWIESGSDNDKVAKIIKHLIESSTLTKAEIEDLQKSLARKL